MNDHYRTLMVNALVRAADPRDQWPHAPLSERVKGVWPLSTNIEDGRQAALMAMVRGADPRDQWPVRSATATLEKTHK